MDATATTIVAVDSLASVKTWLPEEIRLGEGFIEWQTRGFLPEARREGESARAILSAFLRLARATDPDRFLDFARRYGVLGITESGVPGMATSTLPPRINDWFREPIEAWRMYAWNARAIITLAKALEGNQRIDGAGTLERAGVEMPTTPISTDAHFLLMPSAIAYNLKEKSLVEQREWLAWYVDRIWIDPGKLRAVLVWQRDLPHMSFSLGGGPMTGVWPPNATFTVLAARLAAYLTSDAVRRIATCSLCGEIYEASRKPAAHRPNYCDPCAAIKQTEHKRVWARKNAARSRAVVAPAYCSHDCSQAGDS
jgi:hypothetical protein